MKGGNVRDDEWGNGTGILLCNECSLTVIEMQGNDEPQIARCESESL
jgi:hypothetical protein